MSKIKKDRQYRDISFSVEIKENIDKKIDSDFYVEGYATTFKPYVLFVDEEEGEIKEQFLPSAFDNTDMTDIIFQYNHEGKVFARISNATLIVEVDEKGLFIAADLSKTESSRQMYDEIKKGLVTKMSWGFRVGDYYYDKKTKTIMHKTVKKIYDVSAVSIPANNDTNINARSFCDGEIARALKESQECEKLKLRIKLELGD